MKIKFKKLLWIDYLLFAWFLLFVAVWTIGYYHGGMNLWILSIYLVGWGILMIIQGFVRRKNEKAIKNEN
ncbi:hypothetical protein A3K73_05065 [Candidatus Pacearchaeota archaeon RBG_13_36_9]|nr:MAG: hypothetical protein A3K73_05065 [Candidatus Pacearchaeota archaeon RBG_13_36_9]HJX50795.1 hypothetical protein [Candidatus Nanoarchaeia archaeon]